MGRKKIAIVKIEDTNKRMVTFSKRRISIRNKAAELCKLFADIIAHTYSNSPLGVCNVIERFLDVQTKDKKQENRNAHKAKNSTYVQQCRNKGGVGSGSDGFWWDNIDMEELDSVEKLKSVRESLANLKQNLSARKEKLTAAASPLSSSSSTIEDTIIEDRFVEDTATTITEKHEPGRTSSKDHHNLDLRLNLGWKFDDKATTSLLMKAEVGRDETEEDAPLLRRSGRDLVEPCRSHPLTDLAL
ncbi:hypothetical protein MKX03_009574 [Papaver bracteatum]|nr:hypothetical protein MKX03_009574 [Papaver bracteatum]